MLLSNNCKSKNLPESSDHHHHQLVGAVGSETRRVHAAVNLQEEAKAALPMSWPSSSSNFCFHENTTTTTNDNNISTGIEEMKSVEGNNIDNDKDHVAVEVEKHAAVNNANSSFAHSVINMVAVLIGLGQLSTPYALQIAGWASAFLLVALGIVCTYTCYLLGKCLSKNPKLMNYTDLGHLAFGKKGRIMTTSFIYLEIFLALVSYTISLHDNLSTVFSGTHIKFHSRLSTSQMLTLIAMLIALPSLWLRDLSSISFLSSGGILMSVVIFGTVACTAIFGGVRADRKIAMLRLHNVPEIFGIYIFSFAGHTVFPDLYRGMKHPSKFTKVSIVGFSLVIAYYTSLGFMGAKMFGPDVNSQITLSMPRNLIFTKIALWATVITPMTKYALEFAPMAIQIERILSQHYSMKSKARLIVRGCVGSCFLLVILVLALAVPYFEHILSLTGSLVSIAISVIFPCAFYTKVFWKQISKPVLVLNVMLAMVGCYLGVSGTISSFKLLVKNLQRAHSE